MNGLIQQMSLRNWMLRRLRAPSESGWGCGGSCGGALGTGSVLGTSQEMDMGWLSSLAAVEGDAQQMLQCGGAGGWREGQTPLGGGGWGVSCSWRPVCAGSHPWVEFPALWECGWE